MRYFFIILSIAFLNSCKTQKDNGLLKNWRSYDVPTDPQILNKWNSSKTEWKLILRNGEIYAVNDKKQLLQDKLPFIVKADSNEMSKIRGVQTVMQVDNGYLVGYFRGEWGGNLFWFSLDGKQRYEISANEIVKFVKRNDEIYAVAGLDHLGVSEGDILQVKKVNDRWVVKHYLKLPFAPEAVSIDTNNNFIIATSNSLIKVGPNKEIETLIAKGIWYYGLYPTSIIIQKNKVFIGMRQGVYEYDLGSGSQKWLTPE